MDIHELHINSTVWYNNKRVKITAVDNSDDEPFVKTSFRDDKWLHAKLIESIPLTEELLKELGFVEKIVAGTWKMMIKPFGEYELAVSIQGSECGLNVRPLDESKGDMFGSCFSMRDIQYLHTLETLVYLTTKKELI